MQSIKYSFLLVFISVCVQAMDNDKVTVWVEPWYIDKNFNGSVFFPAIPMSFAIGSTAEQMVAQYKQQYGADADDIVSLGVSLPRFVASRHYFNLIRLQRNQHNAIALINTFNDSTSSALTATNPLRIMIYSSESGPRMPKMD